MAHFCIELKVKNLFTPSSNNSTTELILDSIHKHGEGDSGQLGFKELTAQCSKWPSFRSVCTVQGPEKKNRSKIQKSAIFELHKRYAPQNKAENNRH